MKTIFFTLVISLLLASDIYAQTFASIALPREQAVSHIVTQLPQRKYRPGPMCIVGSIVLPVGCVLVLAGLFEQIEASAEQSKSYSPVTS